MNVWSVLNVRQAFFPILLKANHRAMNVTNTSISSVLPNPIGEIYNMPKVCYSNDDGHAPA